MSSSWHIKKEKQRLEAEMRAEESIPEYSSLVLDQARGSAMGGGEDELFEKKLTKEERKAAAKAKKEARRKKKEKNGTKDSSIIEESSKNENNVSDLINEIKESSRNEPRNEAEEALVKRGTICTFSSSRKGVDRRSRDINVQDLTLLHKGMVLLDSTQIMLNHGNRYGLIGRNGCGKSTLMEVLGARSVPIPDDIDLYYLKEEIEASDTMTALEAVMNVDEERERLEKQADQLNKVIEELVDGDIQDTSDSLEETVEEQQEEIMEILTEVYDRLDALDASTAETRARSILKGLGFTHEMQSKKTKEFSGGWRMRVSLSRALFIQPTLLLLDEPTNHLDMEAVIWLEDYLANWKRILLMISHSQDFLNNVCTHTIHFTNKKRLQYYDGNYDQFIKTKREKEANQLKKYKWEQDQIASMKEYIARFGGGNSKMVKQAQSKEKVLAKMVRQGLTEKPEIDKPLNFEFRDPGHLPPPVLAFHDVSFAYPKCQPLYSNVNLAVDLDSRIALVGPNGAGKTTLVKLMASELIPTRGDIRPHGHLKLGRFTQHFIDVLNLNLSPLDFFKQQYPSDSIEDLRKFCGRFGVSGKMQVQKMEELSDGQKSRVVFAKLGRDCPHILLLDEPTNHLDMESIDALAFSIQKYAGGLVLVSHDMRLISQVANEIWICDQKTISKYNGDISDFKMKMKNEIGIGSSKKNKLKGDASIAVTKNSSTKKKIQKKKGAIPPPFEVLPTKPTKTESLSSSDALWGDEETQDTESMSSFNTDSMKQSLPAGKYIPPHLRNR